MYTDISVTLPIAEAGLCLSAAQSGKAIVASSALRARSYRGALKIEDFSK